MDRVLNTLIDNAYFILIANSVDELATTHIDALMAISLSNYRWSTLLPQIAAMVITTVDLFTLYHVHVDTVQHALLSSVH
jgi:hypothetical protein